jgi:Ca2+-binding RTX toxin-like protein
LTGSGGVDAIYGDIGNDLIILNALNAGSFVEGGSGTDTLRLIGGGQYTLGSLTGFEVIELQNNSVLKLTAAQFASGLSSNASVGGDGAIQVDLSLGNQSMVARGMTASGSGFTFAVNGSSGNDVVKVALNSPSAIEGFAGNDQLVGSDQADYIDGGANLDKIRGDGGGDFLFGGTGADVFKYRKVSDSGIGANADTIADFLSGTDRLNFARIDTNPGLAGDQGFAYIGTAAFNASGAAQIRYVDLGADLRVEADVNGDGIADMHVLLQSAGAQTLTVADFVL